MDPYVAALMTFQLWMSRELEVAMASTVGQKYFVNNIGSSHERYTIIRD